MTVVQSNSIVGTQSTQAQSVPVQEKTAFDHGMPDKTERDKIASEFETAFIAQMLQFSGLAKALTTGGGEAVASFTQFYLEELAKEISDNGGFGIADQISAYINAKEDDHGELGRL